ncbi:YceD family protein [Pontixanthobacter aquaemixtae]|uniref:DUF177 domain-containing protein n=1 Tax=Pontixanthobacter aquaemixtae TaxID=1958940 RepID=A0A844ZNK2_9SPHN|nr:YceD family protein [Pontixanthobacter aquaemixtae]MXO89338.1 DUF177 domain-containing protein [Pontixanthobacter aquaemixtae]
MTQSELSRTVKAKALKEEPYVIEATQAEREALSKRFALSELQSLRAEVTLTPKSNAVVAEGRLQAGWLQPCAISGEDFAASADEPLHFRFVPARSDFTPEEEVELTEDDLDELDYDGDSFDLGEAVAQSLGLAIDPYATGPNADATRKEKGIQIEGEQDGPMADMLAALKKG